MPSVSGSGLFVLVVGPSGAGKDTLIAAARQRLERDRGVVFVRRYITRQADVGGEPHFTLSVDEFTARAADGGFALHWRAHGLHYGIPTAIHDDLAAGRTVVANVSRTVVADARARFRRLAVAHITAEPAVRAARLAGRRRESEAEILRRLDRGGICAPEGQDVVTIDNSGALATAVARFLRLLCDGA